MIHKSMRNAALIATLALAGSAFAANVSTDYDHSKNFRQYHTFSFYKVQTADPFFDDRIKTEMTADLTKAGYQMVPSGGDLNITIFENEKDQQEYNTFYNGLGGGGFGWGGRGWGGGWGGGFGQTTTTVQQVPVGTLMVDMYDASSHQLVWRGKATSQLSNKSDKNTKTLDKDIDKMLNGFPPKASQG